MVTPLTAEKRFEKNEELTHALHQAGGELHEILAGAQANIHRLIGRDGHRVFNIDGKDLNGKALRPIDNLSLQAQIAQEAIALDIMLHKVIQHVNGVQNNDLENAAMDEETYKKRTANIIRLLCHPATFKTEPVRNLVSELTKHHLKRLSVVYSSLTEGRLLSAELVSMSGADAEGLLERR